MKKIRNKIKCVVFDMDGTIFDSERVWKNAAEQLNKKYNINIDDDFRANCCGKKENWIIRYLNSTFPNINGAMLRTEWVKLVEEDIEANGVVVKDGFYELLEFLQKHKIPLGLATGSNLYKILLYFKSTHLDVSRVFDVILTINDYKKSKPNPEIYKKMCQRLNCKPKNCLGIEDSVNGAKACWSAGINTILIPDVFKATAETYKNCVGIFKNLNEVLSFLQEVM